MRRYALALLALLGVIALSVVIVLDHRPAPAVTPAPSPQAPFAASIAGTGIVEPLNGSVAVGTPVAGIVTLIEVRPGDQVKQGTILFRIDDSELQGQRLVAQAASSEAQVRLAQATALYQIALKVPDRRAVSEEEMVQRRSAVEVANAALVSARARAQQIDLEVGRRSVRARGPAQVLQVNLRPGEFAQPGAARPLIVLAGGESLVLRVDVDEFEAARIKPGARAVGFLRGGPTLALPLTFERIEPVVVAKTSLTGSGSERVDSRVLQVIYRFAPSPLASSALVGQQLDVFIAVDGAEPAP
ncbi:efflux RND transporter periplasmic adaptor subunit [Massilia sp. PWRC2]|uniref:efflux RND transporter periplasmic adaptor subunit n=1 Tax=Massilia sp. PWRC2 TaxID=2804626 RepID=UPI003CECBB94